jgi:hypothetical protein
MLGRDPTYGVAGDHCIQVRVGCRRRFRSRWGWCLGRRGNCRWNRSRVDGSRFSRCGGGLLQRRGDKRLASPFNRCVRRRDCSRRGWCPGRGRGGSCQRGNADRGDNYGARHACPQLGVHRFAAWYEIDPWDVCFEVTAGSFGVVYGRLVHRWPIEGRPATGSVAMPPTGCWTEQCVMHCTGSRPLAGTPQRTMGGARLRKIRVLHNEAASPTPALGDAPATCSALGTPSLGRPCRRGTSRGYPIISAAHLARPEFPTQRPSRWYSLPEPAATREEARGNHPDRICQHVTHG